MTPRVDTTQFEFSHGRKPRGRGLWMFELQSGHRDNGPREQWTPCRPALTYTEAKRVAVRTARKRGAHTVAVLP